MQHGVVMSIQIAEIVDDSGLSAEELARACDVSAEWVYARCSAGILSADVPDGAGRFDSRALARARRIVHLERAFDADPQLAALTADLIEEVAQLRARLAARDAGRQA